MRYSEQFMEHIEYAFNAFCKVVLRHEVINAWWDNRQTVRALQKYDKQSKKCRTETVTERMIN